MLGLLALIIGLVIGLFWQMNLPAAYSVYLALLILILLDRILQVANAVTREGSGDWVDILSGALADLALASLLTALGQQLGVPLYLAPVFALGNRIFTRFQTVQRRMLRSVYSGVEDLRPQKPKPEQNDEHTQEELKS